MWWRTGLSACWNIIFRHFCPPRRFRRQCRARDARVDRELRAADGPAVRPRGSAPAARRLRARGGQEGEGGGAGGGASSTASSPERVDRLLSRLGYCARSEAKRWVAAGRVTMDGEPVKRADVKVVANDPRLSIDGEALTTPTASWRSCTNPRASCARTTRARARACTTYSPRDGADVTRGWRPSAGSTRTPPACSSSPTTGVSTTRSRRQRSTCQRRTRFCVDADFPPDAPAVFASGTLTLSGEAKPCLPATLRVDEASRRRATLTLVEGKYHQVKRMCEHAGCVVTSLHRRSFGG